MVLCRPFLIEFESGNVVFEEMEKREYQEKNPRINRRACTKTQLPLAAYECFYHCAAPAQQSRGLGGVGRGWADLAFPHYFEKDRQTDSLF